MRPESRTILALRLSAETWDHFLDKQQEGYTYLYDAKAGMFSFGWDATRRAVPGLGRWRRGIRHAGTWITWSMSSVAPPNSSSIRFGLPLDAIKNLGFKIKPILARRNRCLRPGALGRIGFQAFGLGLCMNGLSDPSWQKILQNMVDVELDYSLRHQLPGFLSESYTGEGARVYGRRGHPRHCRHHHAAHHLLRVALQPRGGLHDRAERVERFLAANWPTISKLLTDHGPWEGFNLAKQEVIEVQTSAHTLSLILGLLGTGPENMNRYLEAKGLRTRLAEIYGPGNRVDFLSRETRIFAWGERVHSVVSTRDERGFHVKSDRVDRLGIAFVAPQASGVNLSNGVLTIGYRSGTLLTQVTICLKPVGGSAASPGIANEIFTRFPCTGTEEAEIRVPLPGRPACGGSRRL